MVQCNYKLKNQPALRIEKMPVIKSLAFHCSEENLTAGFKIDYKLCSLIPRQGQFPKEASLEYTMAKWLQKRFSGDILNQFNWSHLTEHVQSRDRSVEAIYLQNKLFKGLEFGVEALADEVITISHFKKIAGLARDLPPQKFRTGRMGINAGKNGVQVEFLSKKHIPQQMRAVLRTLNSEDKSLPVSLRAVWCVAAFLNCHPFPDGNGRTSQALFNLMFLKSGLVKKYTFPLAAINIASSGFFEVCLRRLQLQDQCDMMLRYVDTVVDILELFYDSHESV